MFRKYFIYGFLAVAFIIVATILLIDPLSDSEVTVWERIGEDRELIRTEGDQPLEIGIVLPVAPDSQITATIVIETQYPNLLAELAKRLEDSETAEISLRLVKKGDHSLWGEPGWRLFVESEFVKTYQ